MKLLSIDVKNFLSHKKTYLEVPEGFIGVIGANGSGKSSLIKDSITWALWGRSRVGGAGDELIRIGASSCEVIISFSVDGSIYFVTRHRQKDTKTELILEDSLGDISRPTIKATQEEINKILGMNYDVFVNSCCIEQGQSDSFSNLSPSQAALLLSNILQLDSYAKCKIKAADKCMEAKISADKREAANEYLTKKIEDGEKSVELIIKKEGDLKSLESNIKSLEAKYDKSQDLYNTEYKKWQANSTNTTLIESDISHIDKDLEKLSKQADMINEINGKCPVCSIKMTEECKESIREKALHEYEELLDKKTALEEKLVGSKRKHKDFMTKLADYKLEQKRDQIKTVHSKLDTLKGELNTLKTATLDTEEHRTKLKDNLYEISGFRKTESIYSDLSFAFGPKGIPLMIVDNVLGELEVLINDNLSELSDIPISVELRTQRESVSGELIDTFQIMITEGRFTRGYFNYSGGEKMIIDTAIRLGLSELLSRRNNFKVETLIIDEGLGSLDEPNQKNLINTLKRLEKRFANILVVTHTQAKDYFTNVLEVRKSNGISVLDKHGSVWYTNTREDQ